MSHRGARVLALILCGCSPSTPPPPAQTHTPMEAEAVAAGAPADRKAQAARIAELLRRLAATNDDGPHGPYHRAQDKLQEELWTLASAMAPLPEGDHLLLAAVDRVYTRYDRNYWTGHHFHWPYLCSERAVKLCDKLLAEYPASRLAERTLWLKAYALRLPAVPEDHEAEEDRTTYRIQRRWTPDPGAARKVYAELVSRHPSGRHAKLAKVFAEQKELGIALPEGPDERDPKEPVPLD